MDANTVTAVLALIPGAAPYLVYLPAVWGVCALADAVIPQPSAGSPWLGVRKVVSALGMNFGHAANAIPAGLAPTVKAAAEDASALAASAPAVASALADAKAIAAAAPAVTAAVSTIAAVSPGTTTGVGKL